MSRVHYEITHECGLCGPHDFARRYRAPAARYALETMVYEMLAGFGMLDRPVAYRLMNEARAVDVSPPPRGHYRRSVIKFDDFNRVTFFAHRA